VTKPKKETQAGHNAIDLALTLSGRKTDAIDSPVLAPDKLRFFRAYQEEFNWDQMPK